uniref:Zgc:123278 n=1 Tax=Paramormyrops kingsleyae TaxID=1676925 RepID=A0A3B3R3S5_9TELE
IIMETVRLKKMLSKKYKHRHLIACEIWSVICQYTSLKPVLDTYVFNDGSSRHLMCLTGTIPVWMECNIPVSLWLLQSYPLHPPMSHLLCRYHNKNGWQVAQYEVVLCLLIAISEM